MDAPTNSAEQARTPVYVSFKSFTNFIGDQQEHGLPNRIDRSVLTKFSGGVGNQLISALKFLNLIDEDQSAKPELRTLVDAYGTDEWPQTLGALIKRVYAPILKHDLANATPAQFQELFRNNYQAASDVMRKCESFFLQAAQAAQIPINARIIKHRSSRVGSGRKRNGSTRTRAAASDTSGEQPRTRARRQAHGPYEMLIEILDPASMDDDEQEAVWTLIRYLRRQEVDEQE